MKSFGNQVILVCVFVVSLVGPIGCRRRPAQSTTPELTDTVERSTRRAFDGAPPVIPHKPLGATCGTCHTKTGKAVPTLGYAPANPHGSVGSLQNCRQCHLFKQDAGVFAESLFVGTVQSMRHGERLYPGAPPVIPHSMTMRENCLACHDGPSVRPEIRCSHPERINCKQCHLPTTTLEPPTLVK
jgi:cytochrome c-type protein NapB